MLDLLDYRRQVTELYRGVREGQTIAPAEKVCSWFRRERDDLFRSHPQSALAAAQKATFTRLSYYDYDPAFRVTARVDGVVEPKMFEVELGDDGRLIYRRCAEVTFTLPTGTGRLSLFWLVGYGGGLFLPFGDATNTTATYGGGRYLFDTIKGVDLGATETEIMLDFNYAYNPSCAYNPRWVCPLTPPENRLSFPITAGEKLFS
jgi:uncharacterized protein